MNKLFIKFVISITVSVLGAFLLKYLIPSDSHVGSFLPFFYIKIIFFILGFAMIIYINYKRKKSLYFSFIFILILIINLSNVFVLFQNSSIQNKSFFLIYGIMTSLGVFQLFLLRKSYKP